MPEEKQMQAEAVHLLQLGEGERFAHKTGQPRADGVVEAFHVGGCARALVHGMVAGKDLVVVCPKVAEADAVPVAGRQPLVEFPAAEPVARAHRVSNHLPGAPAQGDPDPLRVGLLLHKAPQLIEFQHVARRARRECLRQRRQRQAFFLTTSRRSFDSPRRCASAPAGSNAPDRRAGFPRAAPGGRRSSRGLPGSAAGSPGTDISASRWAQSRSSPGFRPRSDDNAQPHSPCPMMVAFPIQRQAKFIRWWSTTRK